MARLAFGGQSERYECLVEPLESGRTRWLARYSKDIILGEGHSRWRWLAKRRAERACRDHALQRAVERASASPREPERWHPYV